MSEYRIVSVQAYGKKKYKIDIECIGTLVTMSLYPSEVRKYSIVEDSVISSEYYDELCDILYKRGKERALYYLKTSDKTVAQMRTKLKEGFYPLPIIDRVISFLEEYGYLDDYRYTSNFLNYNKNIKSTKRIKYDLSLKGISRQIIDNVFNEFDEDTESKQIEAYCRKKIKVDTDEKGYNKIMMALIRKGFKYEQVRSVLGRVADETGYRDI